MSPIAVTVAAIIERQGAFLLVEEFDDNPLSSVFNQPAGHVEPDEDLLTAACREAYEEAGVRFTPVAVVGVYQLKARNGKEYLRIAFCGHIPEHAVATPIDPDIVACHWQTREQMLQSPLRSSLVLRCVDDYLRGQRLPLSAFSVRYKDGA